MKNSFEIIAKWAGTKDIFDKSQKIYECFYREKYKKFIGSNYCAKGYFDKNTKINKLNGGYNIYTYSTDEEMNL